MTDPLPCPRIRERFYAFGDPHVVHKWHVWNPFREFLCPGWGSGAKADETGGATDD